MNLARILRQVDLDRRARVVRVHWGLPRALGQRLDPFIVVQSRGRRAPSLRVALREQDACFQQHVRCIMPRSH